MAVPNKTDSRLLHNPPPSLGLQKLCVAFLDENGQTSSARRRGAW
jgi:hypothetical protein